MAPSPGHEAARLGWLADSALTAGRLGEAGALYAQALQGWRAADNLGGVGVTLANLGLVREAQGAHREAIALFEEALAVQRARGDIRLEGVILGNLAGLRLVRGELDLALPLFVDALERAEAARDRQREAGALVGLGAVHHDAGRFELARQHAAQALQVAQAAMADGALAAARANLGALDQEEGALESADAHYAAACALYGARGQKGNLAATLLSRAKLRLEANLDPTAPLQDARELAGALDDRRTLALVSAIAAIAAHHAGDRDRAAALMRSATEGVDPEEHPIRWRVLQLHAGHLLLPDAPERARALLPVGFVPSAAVRTAARLLARRIGG